jgi:hypothetical protein
MSRASGTRAALLAASLLSACAIPPPHPGTFSFAVFGDMPYLAHEEPALDRFIDAMNAEPLAFVVHVGDFKGSNTSCTDALYADRRARFDRSTHPFAYTPGDNEWVDCRRPEAGGYDALERLARLREVFFAQPRFLGPPDAPVQEVMGECARRAGSLCQCPALPENRRWSRPIAGLPGTIVFATLNVQGSNDNWGFDAASDDEQDCRRQANLRWLEEAFANRDARAVVLFFQANPFIESHQRIFDGLREAIVREAVRFGRPVLVVHGDTHRYRVDRPFRDASGRTVGNITRLEVFGSPLLGWVQVTVDPSEPALFRFASRGE